MHAQAIENQQQDKIRQKARSTASVFNEVKNHHEMPSIKAYKSNYSNLKRLAIRQTINDQTVYPLFQAKLKIGQTNDTYEQEADRVAEQVVEISKNKVGKVQSKPLVGEITPLIQRQTEKVPPSIGSGVQSLQGGGRPLTESERSFFEPRFGTDFSNVRVHNNRRADFLARSINARAFTFGNNVVFGAGQYSHNTYHGRKLFAHELSHVVQQSVNEQGIQRTPTATEERDWERRNSAGGVEEISDTYIIIYNFAVNSAELKEEHQSALCNFLSRFWRYNTQNHVYINGHTSSSGPERANDALSDNRAGNVFLFMTDPPENFRRLQIDESRVEEVIGHGEQDPWMPDNNQPHLMARNRRVEVRVLRHRTPTEHEDPNRPRCNKKWAFGEFEIEQLRLIPHGRESGFIIEKVEGVLSKNTGDSGSIWQSKEARYVGLGGSYDIYDILVDIISSVLGRVGRLRRAAPAAERALGTFDAVYQIARRLLQELGVELPESPEDWIYERWREPLEQYYTELMGSGDWACKTFCREIQWDNWVTGGNRYDGPNFEFRPVFGRWGIVVFEFEGHALPNLTWTSGVRGWPGGEALVTNNEAIRDYVQRVRDWIERARTILTIIEIIGLEEFVEYIDSADEMLEIIDDALGWLSNPRQTSDWILIGASSLYPPSNVSCTPYGRQVGAYARQVGDDQEDR